MKSSGATAIVQNFKFLPKGLDFLHLDLEYIFDFIINK